MKDARAAEVRDDLKDSIEDVHIPPDQVEYILRPGNVGDLPEIDSGYEDAPKWYWRIAGLYPGWRGDVSLWGVIFGLGVLLGVLVGGCAAIIGIVTA